MPTPQLRPATEDHRVATAALEVDAPAEQIFPLIAEPVYQIAWDGLDNLRGVLDGGRVRAAGDTFTMAIHRPGESRRNEVVSFTEGRHIAWRPNVPGQDPVGHVWGWDLEPLDDERTLVRHTYDWTALTDPARLERARWTTPERLLQSIARLAALAEGRTLRYRATTYVRGDAADVWAAMTDAQATAHWWGHRNESTWQVGEEWRHVSIDGEERTDVAGIVLAAQAPRLLATTWATAMDPRSSEAPVTILELTEAPGIVRVDVDQMGLPTSRDLSDVAQGWPAVLANLKTWVESGRPLPTDPWRVTRGDSDGAIG